MMALAAVMGMMAVSAACAADPATAPAAADPATDASIRDTLKLLEDRGGTLKDFTASLRYSVEHVREAATETNTGTVAYVREDGKPTKMALQLDNLIIDGAKVREGLNHQIVFDGLWITEKDPENKIYRRIEVAKPGGPKKDPFALRGPIPLPIGQNAAQVLIDFTVEKIAFTDHPTKPVAKLPVALRLTPKVEKVYDFTQLDLVVDTDPSVKLPVRIAKTGLDENITTVIFRDLKINTGAAGKLSIFDVSEPKEAGWKKDIRPLEDGPPATNP
jgi:hypothetical protein